MMQNPARHFKWGRLIAANFVIYVLETISYFFVGSYFGKLWGVDKTWNLQLGVDRIMPWITELFPYYMAWPYVWFIAVPVLLFWALGRQAVAKYVAVSLLMYVIASVIYAVFPTTTTELDFINGTIQTLPHSAPFYENINRLAHNSANVWGSWPSYHNFWASMLVLFPLMSKGFNFKKALIVVMGLVISLATFTLHQHALADAVLTYVMTFGFLKLVMYYKWDTQLLDWLSKPDLV
ncbi:MAG: hypothetical protein LBT80_05240 [Lactobacillaceae bacterium]|jgi:hypothetical protein|nr:hypothetical protein [Lactobacillaceae bacterium]